jgi:hypothetical protein
LLTPLGSKGIPKTVLLRLCAANKLKEPPLCSKKKSKRMEKITNTKAANNFYFLPERNSHLINK